MIRSIYDGQNFIAIGILAVAISITLGSFVALVSGRIGTWVEGVTRI